MRPISSVIIRKVTFQVRLARRVVSLRGRWRRSKGAISGTFQTTARHGDSYTRDDVLDLRAKTPAGSNRESTKRVSNT